MAITKIPEKLKLNKFELCLVPHARKLVNTFGYASSPANLYSGDDNTSRPMDKIHQIQQGLKDYENSKNE